MPRHHAPLDIAVIGTGIAGMSAAWLLSGRHRVTVYEQADRLGGHSNTVDVPGPVGPVAVDTGFIVYNEHTYPNLTALFRHLDVPTISSEMSFAVSLRDGALEYAGTDLRGLFAQPRNLLRPRFWHMLRDLLRFYREAPRDMAALEAAGLHDPGLTLRAYLDARGYGKAFVQDHLLPMAAAIWSTPCGSVGDQPVATFVQFCANHGLLQIRNRPVWRTVAGGSRRYVEKLTAAYAQHVRLRCGVREVWRLPDRVLVSDACGGQARFDHVIIATHPDQALLFLGDRSAAEAALLKPFRYRVNSAVLHTDPSLMPRRRGAWSSWNYLGGDAAEGPAVTYWMNRLQGLRTSQPLFVSLNPPRPPNPARVLHTEAYAHPLLDAAAANAQRLLWELQGVRRTWFCGAWFGAGFHEDGLQAGLAVAEQLGGVRRPWRVPNESGRIHLAAVPPPMERAA
jgi:predicted NAD/FAD-binding protein